MKKCKTSLLHVLELLQRSWRRGIAVGNLQIQLANGGVHPSSAAQCKIFIHWLTSLAVVARSASAAA